MQLEFGWENFLIVSTEAMGVRGLPLMTSPPKGEGRLVEMQRLCGFTVLISCPVRIRGQRGSKNPKKVADVMYGWTHTCIH